MAYRVPQWDKWFEVNRTRELAVAHWFAMPNKQGVVTQRILASEGGLAAFGLAVICLQAASANSERRGVLADRGEFLTEKDIAILARAPISQVRDLMRILLEEKLIEGFDPATEAAMPQGAATIPQGAATIPQDVAPRARVLSVLPVVSSGDSRTRTRARDAREADPETANLSDEKGAGRGEGKAPPQKNAGSRESVARGGALDNGWDGFQAAWFAFAEIDPSPADWAMARGVWARLDPDQRARAIEWLAERPEMTRAAKRALPQNYLSNRVFERRSKAPAPKAAAMDEDYMQAVAEGFGGTITEWRQRRA